MSSLTSLANQVSQLTKLLIESGGEITKDMELAFDENTKSLSEKVDKYYYLLKHLEKQEEYFKELELEAKQARTTLSNARDALKDRLVNTCHTLSTTELVGNSYRFKLQSAKSRLVITKPAHDFDEKYQIVETVYQVNKDLIRQDVESGLEVDGCSLEESKFIKSYINTKG